MSEYFLFFFFIPSQFTTEYYNMARRIKLYGPIIVKRIDIIPTVVRTEGEKLNLRLRFTMTVQQRFKRSAVKYNQAINA